MDNTSNYFFEAVFNNVPEPTMVVKADAPKFTIVSYNKSHDFNKTNIHIDKRGKGLLEALKLFGSGEDNNYTSLVKGLSKCLDKMEMVIQPKFLVETVKNNDEIIIEEWFQVKMVPIVEELAVKYILLTTYNITKLILGMKLRTLHTRLLAKYHTLNVENEELTTAYSSQKLSLGSLLDKNYELKDLINSSDLEVKLSKNHFKILLESIPQMAWANSIDGQVTFYNKPWYKYTGLTYQQTKGSGWMPVVHPDDLQNTITCYNQILNSNKGGQFENRSKRVDGVYRWHLNRMVPLNDHKGNIISWVGTATDIDELKIALQKRDDFINIAGHELKTPITTLKVTLELLNNFEETLTPELKSKLTSQACRNVDKLNLLVEDLLHASKFNDGQLVLNKKNFILSELINESLFYVQSEGLYNIVLTGLLKQSVYADQERISQVIINFVNNAMKYSRDIKIIHIHIEQIGNYIKLDVKDQGYGISEKHLPHLFDRYYRAEKDATTYAGLGLGLYIATEIIKKHNGKIGVESTIGVGSTFWFMLPT